MRRAPNPTAPLRSAAVLLALLGLAACSGSGATPGGAGTASLSPVANSGPPTDVAAEGEESFDIALEAGEYTFVCDPHASQMNGSFTVG